MIERNGKVIVEIIPDVASDNLRKIIKEKVKKGSKVYSDRFTCLPRHRQGSYSSLVINGFKHIKIDKDKTFANGKIHINTIESFWAYVKENLAKFHGIKPEKLYLYLKELEFRFNHRNNNDLQTLILTYLLNPTTLST